MSYQRDYEKRLDIAVIGVGGHSYRNILPALNFLPVRLKAVCDVNGELARKTATQYGCKAYENTADMYAAERLDAAVVVVSPRLHPELVVQAFRAGLHVWVEKPIALRTSQVREMIEARGDRTCVVGLKKVFMPAAQKALEVIRSPKYGGLISLLGVYPMDIPADGASVLSEGRQTNWLANGCHPLSLLIAAGGRVRGVTTVRGEQGGGACVLEFESGIVGNLHLASGPQPIERFAFFGKSWHLDIWDGKVVSLQRGIPFDYGKTENFAPPGDESGAVTWEPQNCLSTLENHSVVTQGIFAELKHFCDAVLQGRKPEQGTLEFALHLQAVYEAALLSQGSRVSVEA